jgi:hypothetical protein
MVLFYKSDANQRIDFLLYSIGFLLFLCDESGKGYVRRLLLSIYNLSGPGFAEGVD